jgi:hypothetical protein
VSDDRSGGPAEQQHPPSSPPQGVVLVEGDSDRRALEALATRRGRDLTGEGVAIVAIGGATNIRRFLERFGPYGLDVALAGLCDEAEGPFFRRALVAAGLLSDMDGGRAALEGAGFFVCEPDLEGELIRALGVEAVERVIEAEGELASLRLLQRQPAHQGQPVEGQLHRFMGTRAGRKAAYARRLVEVLDAQQVPHPLDGVLGRVGSPSGRSATG